MSSYEALTGEGKLSDTDFRELRKMLIKAQSRDLEEYGAIDDFAKAHIHTYKFDIPSHVFRPKRGIRCAGVLTMSKINNTFKIEIFGDDNAVYTTRNTHFMKVLINFLQNLPKDNSEFGASFVVEAENDIGDVDYGEVDAVAWQRYREQDTFYGGWKED